MQAVSLGLVVLGLICVAIGGRKLTLDRFFVKHGARRAAERGLAEEDNLSVALNSKIGKGWLFAGLVLIGIGVAGAAAAFVSG